MRTRPLAKIALPYSRLELPGWGKVLKAAGVFNHDGWDGAAERVVRGKMHGYRMRVWIDDWSERQTYFLGRYYDLGTQLLVTLLLQPGDTFVDVGGNIGMVTLVAASRVGEGGQVHTFEPNPDAARRIREALDDNGIRQVTLHPVGVSDRPEKLTLSVLTEHMGMATFAEPEPEDQNLVSKRHTVDVVRGDDVLPANLPGTMTMKMDIEGFECRAIRGLLTTVRRYKPALITEVVGHHLKRAGHSVAELFDLLRPEGYRPYRVAVKRKFLRQRLSLRLIDAPDESMDCDVAWLHPGGPHEARLRPFFDA